MYVLFKEASHAYTVHDALPILFLLFLCKVMHSRTFSCITAPKVILRSCNNSQGHGKLEVHDGKNLVSS